MFYHDSEQRRPLTRTGLSNLVAFTRLLGYVRHFYPGDEATNISWDRFAIEGVRSVEGCENPNALAGALNELFHPIAPAVQIATADSPSTSWAKLLPPENATGLKQVRWQHFGCGQLNPQGWLKDFRSNYRSQRVWIEAQDWALEEEESDPVNPPPTELGGGVAARIPLALYSNTAGTWPRGSEWRQGQQDSKYSGTDRATRLAAVALCWNVFQHFYPYFEIFKIDWQSELLGGLEAAATDWDEHMFCNTLARMVAALRDGHGFVQLLDLKELGELPLTWEWVQDQLVITETLPEAAKLGLQIGDGIRGIDGKEADAVIEAAETLISSATAQWKRCRALSQLRHGPRDALVMLRVGRPGIPERVIELRYTPESRPRPRRWPAEVFSELKPGIFYFDTCSGTSEQFEAALSKLETAKGVVFDIRGYPNICTKFLRHLTDTPLLSAIWKVPFVHQPDQRVPAYVELGRWTLEPLQPRLFGKIAFLTDASAVSYAESILGIVEAYRLGDIVGSPTAGTNGDINSCVLPGGYRVSWTGMRVVKHDGSEHHGVGIRPTIPISYTMKGIAEGRDEFLERALEVVNT
jgi:C-terminal processing protease CtpA/Prc